MYYHNVKDLQIKISPPRDTMRHNLRHKSIRRNERVVINQPATPTLAKISISPMRDVLKKDAENNHLTLSGCKLPWHSLVDPESERKLFLEAQTICVQP